MGRFDAINEAIAKLEPAPTPTPKKASRFDAINEAIAAIEPTAPATKQQQVAAPVSEPTPDQLAGEEQLQQEAQGLPALRAQGEASEVARKTGGALVSGVDLVASNLDRLQRPFLNAAYPVFAALHGNDASDRFDWGKAQSFDENGFFGELGRVATMSAQAFGRGVVDPLSIERPGATPGESVSGQDLATMMVFGKSLQEHPELLNQHPYSIFGLGLGLEVFGPSILRYLKPDHVVRWARNLHLVDQSADFVSAEQALIAKAKSEEVRSGVQRVLRATEEKARALEAANAAARVQARTILPSRQSPAGYLGNLREVVPQVTEAAGDAIRAYGSPVAEKVADLAQKVPYLNAASSLEREKEIARKGLEAAGEGFKLEPTAAGQAAQGVRHLLALELPGGYTVGTGHISPWLNKMPYEKVAGLVDALEVEGAYGEAAKLAVTKTLSAVPGIGLPQQWLDAVGDFGQKVGDATQSIAKTTKRMFTPSYGDAGYDAAREAHRMLTQARTDEADAIAGSYTNLQRQGAEAMGVAPEEFAKMVARCESKAYYQSAPPLVQRTWDLAKSANDEYTKWWNSNGGARKLLSEDDLNNYFPHMITDEHKAYRKQMEAMGELRRGKVEKYPLPGPMRFSDRDKLGYQRKLLEGDGTARGINEEIRKKYGIEHDVFVEDWAPILSHRAKATARAFTNREFVESVKEIPVAKRTGMDYEPTPEGMIGKKFTRENGMTERMFVDEDKITDVAKAERKGIVDKYRTQQYAMTREHKATVARNRADAAARRRSPNEMLEEEVRNEGAFRQAEQPSTVKISDLFPEADGAPSAARTVDESIAASVPPPPSTKAVRTAASQYDPSRPIARQLKDLRANMRAEIDDNWKRFLSKAQEEGWARKADDKLRATGDKNYRPVRNPAFTGYAFPKEIADDIDQVMQNQDDLLSNVGKSLDTVTGWFRAQALLTPRYHLRNFVGNEYNKLLFTGVSAEQIARYTEAHALSWATQFGKRDIKIATPGFSGTVGELDDILRERGAIGSALTATETPVSAQGTNFLFKRNRWLANQVEDQGRRQMVINQLLSGKSLESSIGDMYTTMFNFGRKAAFERQYATRGAYFWSWPRNNVPYQLEMFIRHPGRQMVMPTLVRNMREFYGRKAKAGNYEQEYSGKLARYMAEKMAVDAHRDKDTGVRQMVLLGEWLPLENANIALTPLSRLIARGHPSYDSAKDAANEMAQALLSMGAQPAKALIEATFNYDTFFENIIDKLVAQDQEGRVGVTTPKKLGPFVMTARERHLANVFTLAKWADDLFEAGGSEVYRSKPWFIRVLKAAGVNIVELDPLAEERRTDVRLKGLESEAKRQQSRTRDVLDYNQAPVDGNYPLLEAQEKNIERIADAISNREGRSGPWQ